MAALPYLSRWLQRSVDTAIALLALAAVVNRLGTSGGHPRQPGAGLGRDRPRPSHLRFAARPSLDRRGAASSSVTSASPPRRSCPYPDQEWGVGRFTALVDGGEVDVSVYGRDASDAQLLAKTARFLFYRDSGPTLALTRRQQVEHEAYLTLMAARAGARVPAVLVAGPAGPAHDALLVTRPPHRRAGCRTFAPFVPPERPPSPGQPTDARSGGPRDRRRAPAVRVRRPGRRRPSRWPRPPGPDHRRTVGAGGAAPGTGAPWARDRRRSARRHLRPADGAAAGRTSPTEPCRPGPSWPTTTAGRDSSTSGWRRRWPPPISSTGTPPPSLAAVAEVAGPERALAVGRPFAALRRPGRRPAVPPARRPGTGGLQVAPGQEGHPDRAARGGGRPRPVSRCPS